MAGNNPTRGMRSVSINGLVYILQFTWDELSRVEAEYGEKGPDLSDIEVLANVASIGFSARHPEVTPEKIRELSPPVFVLHGAVTDALKYAYWGDASVPVTADSDEGDAPKGKKHQALRKAWRWLFVAALRLLSFGRLPRT